MNIFNKQGWKKKSDLFGKKSDSFIWQATWNS